MLSKYKDMTEQQRWIEYGKLKAEWVSRNGYSDAVAYDAFIKQITKDLGI